MIATVGDDPRIRKHAPLPLALDGSDLAGRALVAQRAHLWMVMAELVTDPRYITTCPFRQALSTDHFPIDVPVVVWYTGSDSR